MNTGTQSAIITAAAKPVSSERWPSAPSTRSQPVQLSP
jgi:hypothetical protein